MQRPENEFVKNMEYLIQLLHNEWECSKKTYIMVSVSIEESKEVNNRLVNAIQKNVKHLGEQELDFRKTMIISKDNFVLLRLVKKVKKAEEMTMDFGFGLEYTVELDKEEYKLFVDIVETREG